MPIDTSALADAARDLRADVSSVRRVLIATVDGLPVYDDAQDIDTARFSALGASTLGQGQRVTDVAKGGEFQEAVLQGSEASLTMYAAGSRLVLVLLVASDVNLALLHRKARAIARELAELDVVAVPGQAPGAA